MFWHGSPSCGFGSRTTLLAGATLLPNAVLPPGRKHVSWPVKFSTWPTFAGSAVTAGQSGLNVSSMTARLAIPGCSTNAVSAARIATNERLNPADISYHNAGQTAVFATQVPDRAQLRVGLHLSEHEDRVRLALRDRHLVARRAVRRLDRGARRARLVVDPRERAGFQSVAPGRVLKRCGHRNELDLARRQRLDQRATAGRPCVREHLYLRSEDIGAAHLRRYQHAAREERVAALLSHCPVEERVLAQVRDALVMRGGVSHRAVRAIANGDVLQGQVGGWTGSHAAD